MKKILIVGLLLLGLASVAVAQESDEALAARYGVTFPVVQLGGCGSLFECEQYCRDPVNHSQCVAFAKEKGFYGEEEFEEEFSLENVAFWERASQRLGCSSRETCEALCSAEANLQLCDQFAKSEGLDGGIEVDPGSAEILAEAQVFLGCDSKAGCLEFCADPANSTTCGEFAVRVGIAGGEDLAGPGGCTNEDSCQAYCKDPDNFDQCAEFVPLGSSFVGPGECESSSECRDYCEDHATECRSYSTGASGVYIPISCGRGSILGPGGVCTSEVFVDRARECFSSGSFWDGSNCLSQPPAGVTINLDTIDHFEVKDEWGGCANPAECYDYCSGNPGVCGDFDSTFERPPEDFSLDAYEDYQSQDYQPQDYQEPAGTFDASDTYYQQPETFDFPEGEIQQQPTIFREPAIDDRSIPPADVRIEPNYDYNPPPTYIEPTAPRSPTLVPQSELPSLPQGGTTAEQYYEPPANDSSYTAPPPASSGSYDSGLVQGVQNSSGLFRFVRSLFGSLFGVFR